MATAVVCMNNRLGQERLQEVLTACGVQTVLFHQSLEKTAESVCCRQPDLIFLEAADTLASPGLVDALTACCPAVLILLVAEQEFGLLQKYTERADGFLMSPLPPVRAESLVKLTLVQARRTYALRTALEESRTALKERKQIERAKGLIMASEGISEDQAYRRMRSQSMGRRISMARLAEEMLRLGPQSV